MQEKGKYGYVGWGITFLVLISIFLFFRTTVTTQISMTDETHYIATAYRFFKGDAVLVDDWSPEQLNGILMLPFVCLFRMVATSTEGIVLYFRLVYLISKAVLAIYAWWRLERCGKYGIYGLLGVILFYLATPFNIDCLSYNTIPLMMVFLICIIAITPRDKNRDYFLCGVALAFSVLAQPFTILLYFCMGAEWLLCFLPRFRQGKKFFCKGKCFGLITAGAACVAFFFLLYVFRKANVKDILINLQYILNEPDHGGGERSGIIDYLLKLKNTSDIFWKSYDKVIMVNLLSCTVAIGLTLGAKHKKMLYNVAQICSGICLLISCIIQLSMKSFMIENEIWIPFAGYALIQLLINERKLEEWSIFCFLGSYIIAIALGTNTGVHAPNAAMAVLGIFSVILFGRRTERAFGHYRIGEQIIMGLIVGCVFAVRILICWDNIYNPEHYSWKIDKGPFMGTYTTEAIYQNYMGICDDLDQINWNENDILFCGSETPVAYLYADVGYGTMGTPFFHMNYERYQEYLRLHPDKVPDIIYYNELTGGAEETAFIDKRMKQYEPIIMGEKVLLKKCRN